MAGEPGHVHDRELLDALEAIKPYSFAGSVWRCAWTSRDPLIGSTHGGRWHPPETMEGLYTSLKVDGALAEIEYHLSRQPVFSTSAAQVHEFEVKALRVLRLTPKVLQTLGADPRSGTANYPRTQAIGAAAYFLEYEGLLVPSARWDCENLLIFVDRVDVAATIQVVRRHDVNWPAWNREKEGRLAK